MVPHQSRFLVYLPLLVALGAAPILVGALTRPAQAQEKHDSLDDQWKVKSFTGGMLIQERGGASALRFKDKVIVWSFPVAPMKDPTFKFGIFKTDPTRTPKQIDLTFKFEGDEPLLGIYKFEKGILTLCFNEQAKEKRPTKFEAAAFSETVLIVLERDKLDPAVEKVVEKAQKWEARPPSQKQSEKNLEQLGTAFFDYLNTFNRFPAAAIYKDGKPLLSWRVALLPYLNQEDLYGQFKLNEAWDSKHNLALLEKMPAIYTPVRGKTKQPHSTYYQAFTGPGTMFEGDKGRSPVKMVSSTSDTILVAEAGEAVPWTKPEDIPYDPRKNLPKLGGLFDEGFHILRADSSVVWVGRRFDAPTLRLAISNTKGGKVDWKNLEP